MREIGVRMLREQLSRVLAEVEAGESVVVTKAGQPVARIEPAYPSVPSDVQRLLASGRAHWDGHPLEPLDAMPPAPGPNVSDILLAQRGDENDALPGQ